MPRMLEEFQWEGNVLHATYNHGITLTSRIASDKPNAQNFPPVFKKYIVSRFA
jgi:DNA polymerase I-like protein with 3'-5' exonuclease and polymerase domains